MNEYTSYYERMSNLPQFRWPQIDPIWKPGTGDVAGFIHDEVVRQGHDPRIYGDGGKRVEWMASAWAYAQAEAAYGLPTMTSISSLGALVEKMENYHGFRHNEIYIRDRAGAPWHMVPSLMTTLVDYVKLVDRDDWVLRGPHPDDYSDDWQGFSHLAAEIRTVTDWYGAFEAIHPFGDGNGRTGKILSNWLGNTLDNPVLVPDLFGGNNP